LSKHGPFAGRRTSGAGTPWPRTDDPPDYVAEPSARGSRRRAERTPQALESQRQLSHDELGLEMQHTKAQRVEPRITASISAEPSRVIRPIDLNDEPAGGREKVNDVLAQDDLPSERDPELSTGQLSPQASFGERGLSTHDASAFVE